MTRASVTRSDLPVIAIVGRVNVGKSALWNRIVEAQRAIVSDVPHTTRDRNIGIGIWKGYRFEIIDTGGIDTENDEIGTGIRRQVNHALKQAHLVFFVIDAKVGVLPDDRLFAKELRKTKKPVILVSNKTDSMSEYQRSTEGGIYGLGYGDTCPVSAATGKGIGDLLDRAYDELEKAKHPPIMAKEGKETGRKAYKTKEEEEGPKDIHIALIGRTNVGKSSLTNAILGEERVIVSNIPHTTREPQDTELTYNDRRIVLIDTAGMRKRAHIKNEIEIESIKRNRSALDRADVAFLILDATETPTSQDKELGGLMKDTYKGLIIVCNKWDLVEGKTTSSTNEYERELRTTFPFLAWAPIIFVSAKTGKRALDLLDIAIKIQEERERQIDYNAINKLLKNVIKQKRPIQTLGPKSPYIHDIAQVGSEPPKFVVTVRGEKENIHPSWLRFLERRIREKFGFEGTPISVYSTNVPMAKSERAWNVHGPGMEAEEDAKGNVIDKRVEGRGTRGERKGMREEKKKTRGKKTTTDARTPSPSDKKRAVKKAQQRTHARHRAKSIR